MAKPATPGKASAPAPSGSEGRPGPEERLKKLQELYKKGLLDKKEFDAKKAEILKEL